MKISQELRTSLKQVIAVVCLWRVALFFIAAVAPRFLAYKPSFPYADAYLLPSGLPSWLYSWANFDGVHYLTIVKDGYLTVDYIQAFFPVFPGLMWLVNLLLHQPIVSGLLVSTLSSVTLFCLWFILLKQEFGQRVAWVGVFVLLMFPTAFFFGAVYGESFFLSLVIGAFLAARNKVWWLAAVLTAIASATRVVGIFLLPALLLELYLQHQSRPLPFLLKQHWKTIGLLVLGSTGLLGYMAFLQKYFNDPLYFAHVQSEFGSGRQESIVLFPQVVWRYIKIFLTYTPWDLKFFAILQEGFFTLAAAGMFILALIKKIRLSYLLFAALAFILPTTTGTFSSMPRYILVCFPLFMLLALFLSKRRYLMIGYLLASSVLLIVNLILFIQGYWVA